MILVTGSNGQLGFDVVRELSKRSLEYIETGKKDFDIANYKEVKSFLLKHKPESIIHCAAYTTVDKAEEERDLCYEVNVNGTENIAKVCKMIDAKMIYISTDYVFDGTKGEAYEIDDKPNPISVYGESKYYGELKVQEYLEKYFIVRTSWVFGSNGNNFVKTMIRLGKEKKEIKVVCDQVGSPTYTVDLAKLLCDMVISDRYGIYHATNEGFCSWAEFAEQIMKSAQLECRIKYINTSQYNSIAKRPLYAKLSKASLLKKNYILLPKWQDSLNAFIRTSEREAFYEKTNKNIF